MVGSRIKERGRAPEGNPAGSGGGDLLEDGRTSSSGHIQRPAGVGGCGAFAQFPYSLPDVGEFVVHPVDRSQQVARRDGLLCVAKEGVDRFEFSQYGPRPVSQREVYHYGRKGGPPRIARFGTGRVQAMRSIAQPVPSLALRQTGGRRSRPRV